ncbi:MAG: aldo/keto reductase, partial [Anaerolineaceae bacterium]|nr:aldo/keto reductase [Anaerolineaceae bacterium]
MQLRRLGSSGVRVSAIGIGSNQFGGKVDQNGVHNILALARELEVNFLDTANTYGGGESERLLGRALRGQREHFLVATKAFFPVGPGPNERGASRHHLLRAVEDSLRRLQTDRI